MRSRRYVYASRDRPTQPRQTKIVIIKAQVRASKSRGTLLCASLRSRISNRPIQREFTPPLTLASLLLRHTVPLQLEQRNFSVADTDERHQCRLDEDIDRARLIAVLIVKGNLPLGGGTEIRILDSLPVAALCRLCDADDDALLRSCSLFAPPACGTTPRGIVATVRTASCVGISG